MTGSRSLCFWLRLVGWGQLNGSSYKVKVSHTSTESGEVEVSSNEGIISEKWKMENVGPS